jgi:hypothetical protein
MISGAPVLKVSVAGSTTPTDFLVPSGKVMPWLTHLPSKYTLALGGDGHAVDLGGHGETINFTRSVPCQHCGMNPLGFPCV